MTESLLLSSASCCQTPLRSIDQNRSKQGPTISGLITRYYDYHITPSTKSKFSSSHMENALLWLASESPLNLSHRRIEQYRGWWLWPYMQYIRSRISFFLVHVLLGYTTKLEWTMCCCLISSCTYNGFIISVKLFSPLIIEVGPLIFS